MNIQIFGKSKCFDTKKAERWFKERRIRFQSIDLGKYGISPGELKSVLNAVGLEALVDPKHPDAALLAYLAYDADKVEKLLMGGVFMALTVLIFIQIIIRWMGLQSFSWLEEIAQYSYLCVVFVGTSIGISEGGLSRVSVYKSLPAPIVKIIDLAIGVLATVVSGYSAYLSYEIFVKMLKLKMTTSVLSMPISFFYAFIMVSFAGMTIRFLISTIFTLTEPRAEAKPAAKQ